jgi:hypothetical protein
MRFGPLAAVLLVLVCASAAHAQTVTVEFVNGQVNLRAQNAPVRAILAEWARRGGTTIVNGDRIAGAPLTLELTGVTERQALDIVLRNVAGYMLAPRRAGTSGISTFDRILILPTSVAPRTAAAPTAPPAAFGAARPLVPQPRIIRQPPPVAIPQPGDDDADVAEPDPADDPPTPATRPAPPRIVRPGMPPQPLGPEPQIVTEEPEDDDAEEPAAVTPTPGNPFGVPAGSGLPGVIAPVPQQQQRPPGR